MASTEEDAHHAGYESLRVGNISSSSSNVPQYAAGYVSPGNDTKRVVLHVVVHVHKDVTIRARILEGIVLLNLVVI